MEFQSRKTETEMGKNFGIEHLYVNGHFWNELNLEIANLKDEGESIKY